MSASFVVCHHCIPLVLTPPRLLLQFLSSHSGDSLTPSVSASVFPKQSLLRFYLSCHLSHFLLPPSTGQILSSVDASNVFMFLPLACTSPFDIVTIFVSLKLGSKHNWALFGRFVESVHIKVTIVDLRVANYSRLAHSPILRSTSKVKVQFQTCLTKIDFGTTHVLLFTPYMDFNKE